MNEKIVGDEEWKALKKEIRNLSKISSKDLDYSVDQLSIDYARANRSQRIPFVEYGFSSLLECLRFMNDTIRVETSRNIIIPLPEIFPGRCDADEDEELRNTGGSNFTGVAAAKINKERFAASFRNRIQRKLETKDDSSQIHAQQVLGVDEYSAEELRNWRRNTTFPDWTEPKPVYGREQMLLYKISSQNLNFSNLANLDAETQGILCFSKNTSPKKSYIFNTAREVKEMLRSPDRDQPPSTSLKENQTTNQKPQEQQVDAAEKVVRVPRLDTTRMPEHVKVTSKLWREIYSVLSDYPSGIDEGLLSIEYSRRYHVTLGGRELVPFGVKNLRELMFALPDVDADYDKVRGVHIYSYKPGVTLQHKSHQVFKKMKRATAAKADDEWEEFELLEVPPQPPELLPNPEAHVPTWMRSRIYSIITLKYPDGVDISTFSNEYSKTYSASINPKRDCRMTLTELFKSMSDILWTGLDNNERFCIKAKPLEEVLHTWRKRELGVVFNDGHGESSAPAAAINRVPSTEEEEEPVHLDEELLCEAVQKILQSSRVDSLELSELLSNFDPLFLPQIENMDLKTILLNKPTSFVLTENAGKFYVKINRSTEQTVEVRNESPVFNEFNAVSLASSPDNVAFEEDDDDCADDVERLYFNLKGLKHWIGLDEVETFFQYKNERRMVYPSDKDLKTIILANPQFFAYSSERNEIVARRVNKSSTGSTNINVQSVTNFIADAFYGFSFDQIVLEIGEEIEVAVCKVSDPDDVSVQVLAGFKDKFLTLMETMERFYTTESEEISQYSVPIDLIKPGFVCAALVESIWCRVEIVNAADRHCSSVLVRCIDYVTSKKVQGINLRLLKREFLEDSIPAIGLRVALAGVEPLDGDDGFWHLDTSKVIDQLTDKRTKISILVKNVRLDSIAEVQLSVKARGNVVDVNDELIKRGLVKCKKNISLESVDFGRRNEASSSSAESMSEQSAAASYRHPTISDNCFRQSSTSRNEANVAGVSTAMPASSPEKPNPMISRAVASKRIPTKVEGRGRGIRITASATPPPGRQEFRVTSAVSAAQAPVTATATSTVSSSSSVAPTVGATSSFRNEDTSTSSSDVTYDDIIDTLSSRRVATSRAEPYVPFLPPTTMTQSFMTTQYIQQPMMGMPPYFMNPMNYAANYMNAPPGMGFHPHQQQHVVANTAPQPPTVIVQQIYIPVPMHGYQPPPMVNGPGAFCEMYGPPPGFNQQNNYGGFM